MINAFVCNQFMMISSFDDFSCFNNDDIICPLHCLEPMCHDDDRSIFKEYIECLRDLLFWEAIEGRSRLIEKYDLRIFKKYFRDRKTLFLSSTQSYA